MFDGTGSVLGANKPDVGQRMICFGAYALLYTKTTNNMKGRSVPGIVLNPSDNGGGGYHFMSLRTSKEIHGYDWDELPIDNDIVVRVESLRQLGSQPEIVENAPIFEWAPGVPIMDQDEENMIRSND